MDIADYLIPVGPHKVNDKGERYFVFAKIGSTVPTLVYEGLDRVRAERSANFWDERVDTHILTHRVAMDPMSVLYRKFDDLIERIQKGY